MNIVSSLSSYWGHWCCSESAVPMAQLFPPRKTTVLVQRACLGQTENWQARRLHPNGFTLPVWHLCPRVCTRLSARISPLTILAGSISSLPNPVNSLLAAFPAYHTGAPLRLSRQGNDPTCLLQIRLMLEHLTHVTFKGSAPSARRKHLSGLKSHGQSNSWISLCRSFRPGAAQQYYSLPLGGRG